ncbi:MAG: hypothetical protein IPN47_10260 [Gemmatimonadetes bacterium]|nr:hypothetical protein [Gemmatimonadota bacterium]
MALLLTMIVYERHPHIPDEVAYLVEARYLAQNARPAGPTRPRGLQPRPHDNWTTGVVLDKPPG